jgi:drug/metabolite transporter (DMT)-like permease
MSRRSLILFISLSIIWGLPYLFIKYAIAELDPTIVVFARTAPAAIILLAWSAYRGVLKENLKFWKAATVFAFVEMVFPWWLITDAERQLDSGITGLLIATVPLFCVIIARIRGDKTASSPKRLAGLALGLVGVGLLVGLDPGDLNLPLLQVAMVLVSSVGYAVGPIAISSTLGKADSPTIIGMSLAILSIVYIPFAWLNWPTKMPSAQALSSLAVLAIVCTVAAFLIFFKLIEAIGGISATLVTYINTAVAVVLGVVILGEPVTLGLIIGFPLVLGGSWLASKH